MTSVVLMMISRLLFFRNQEIQLNEKIKNILVILVSIIAGTLSGITGIGVGILIGPTLIIFHLTDLKKVSPVINVVIFVSCFFASINYLGEDTLSYPKIGMVRIDIAISLFFASQFGSWWGRKYNNMISSSHRKLFVGIVLGLFVLKLWILN